MDISTVIYAIFGAVLGALLATFIMGLLRKKTQSQFLSNILLSSLTVAGVILCTQLYKTMALPRLATFNTAQIDRALPILSYVKNQSPSAYARLVRPLDQVDRNSQLTTQHIALLQSSLNQQLTQKKQVASVETIKAQNVLAAELYDTLKTTAPGICTLKTNGRSHGPLAQVLDQNYPARELQALARFFSNSERPANTAVDLERGQALFSSLIKELSAHFEIENFNPTVPATTENRAEHEKICALQAEISRSWNTLSDADVINLYSFTTLTNAGAAQ